MSDGSEIELLEPVFVERPARPWIAGRVAGSNADSPVREVQLGEVIGLEVRKLDGDRAADNVLAGGALVVVIAAVIVLVVASGGLPILGS